MRVKNKLKTLTQTRGTSYGRVKLVRNFSKGAGATALTFVCVLLIFGTLPSTTTPVTTKISGTSIKTLGGKAPSPHAAGYVLTWNTTWGGSVDDYGRGVAVDGSGNMFLAGSAGNATMGSVDAFLTKYYANGTEDWSHTWGGSSDDFGQGVAVDGSGNAFLAGTTNSFGSPQAFIAKYNPGGTLLWNITWSGRGNASASAITVDAMGNPIITGQTNGSGSYAFTAKFMNMTGSFMWKNDTFPGTPNGVAVDAAGNVYTSASFNGFMAYLTKWNWTGYPDLGNFSIFGGNVVAGGDAVMGSSNPYITGSTRDYGAGGSDAFLYCVNSTVFSTPVWNLTWGGSSDDSGAAVAVD